MTFCSARKHRRDSKGIKNRKRRLSPLLIRRSEIVVRSQAGRVGDTVPVDNVFCKILAAKTHNFHYFNVRKNVTVLKKNTFRIVTSNVDNQQRHSEYYMKSERTREIVQRQNDNFAVGTKTFFSLHLWGKRLCSKRSGCTL